MEILILNKSLVKIFLNISGVTNLQKEDTKITQMLLSYLYHLTVMKENGQIHGRVKKSFKFELVFAAKFLQAFAHDLV